MRSRTRLVQSIIVLILVLCSTNPVAAQSSAASTLLTVSGAAGINIRACPAVDCDVLAVANLGSTVTQTGEPVDGFTPVSFDSVEGYAFSLYLVAPEQDLWFREGEAGCNRVALIFDIGIGFTPSQSIVDTLVSTGTAATMFPMGSFATNQPAYLQQLHAAGFPIGTHGYDPVTLTELGPAQIAWDVETSMTVIGEVIGGQPLPYFTPYAANTNAYVRQVVAGLGVLPVGWRVAAPDYTWTATEDLVYQEVMNNVYDGAIVEMHLDGPATEQSTALALPRIIADLNAQGYTFVTVPQMTLPCGALSGT
jgi:peptidoglycan/xylan/chitin deacetylase (PgdA/CDA1 family)